MGEVNMLLYACCPRCGKPLGRARRCEGMELNCSKCGSLLMVTVDQDAKVVVELVRRESPPVTKSNNAAAAPKAPDSARTVKGVRTEVKSVIGLELAENQ